MSKYTPLGEFLARHDGDSFTVSFSEIEDRLGFSLPPSKLNRAWWSNNPTNNVMTKVWLDAGWRTREVDMENEKVTFFRASSGPSGGASDREPVATPSGTLDLGELNPVARKVLIILARRSGRSPTHEAIEILNEALAS